MEHIIRVTETNPRFYCDSQTCPFNVFEDFKSPSLDHPLSPPCRDMSHSTLIKSSNEAVHTVERKCSHANIVVRERREGRAIFSRRVDLGIGRGGGERDYI